VKGWIGVDLDGTLAEYSGWRGPKHIGEPVPAMLERVKQWIGEGKTVKIFTARVSRMFSTDASEAYDAIEAGLLISDWCEKHIGKRLPVTCVKDFGMIEFWDDRAVQVVINTGQPVTLA
jgi:hypothetical protein